MTDRTVTLKLNQQQLELIERTIGNGAAADRTTLIRRALREYGARHLGIAKAESSDG